MTKMLEDDRLYPPPPMHRPNAPHDPQCFGQATDEDRLLLADESAFACFVQHDPAAPAIALSHEECVQLHHTLAMLLSERRLAGKPAAPTDPPA